ncbi:RES family NAD+ phosphorylase [Alteromonas halophila]|uniref:RES domain-containing protein n=1 Tax=Alteromonas halophila TaxID=516698 RepID=A0A918JKR7_9ALTE|nr:RES family NAD+ phosphorylase [Alteromonas halophila]GGW82265.1 hypothetical protein GCM10007391_14110 [Alteromonas halophila]
MILFKTIKTPYVDTWYDYSKTATFKSGGRWNSAGIAAMYTSTNPQNAMLELGNYCSSPKMANTLYKLLIFEVKELRLFEVDVTQLPSNWDRKPHGGACSTIGDRVLSDVNYDGLLIPSATINKDAATHPVNSVRKAAYANVVMNISHMDETDMRVIDVCSPVFSTQMFSAKK